MGGCQISLWVFVICVASPTHAEETIRDECVCVRAQAHDEIGVYGRLGGWMWCWPDFGSVCVCVCVCVLVRAGAHVNRNSDLVVCDFGFVGGGGWVWMVVGGCAGISGTEDLCV